MTAAIEVPIVTTSDTQTHEAVVTTSWIAKHRLDEGSTIKLTLKIPPIGVDPLRETILLRLTVTFDLPQTWNDDAIGVPSWITERWSTKKGYHDIAYLEVIDEGTCNGCKFVPIDINNT
jgi:hypothetical protein